MPTPAEGAPHVEWLRRAAGRPQTPAASLRRVTPAELAAHSSADSAWVALRGAAGVVVYDVTEYARYHPGGLAQLLRGAGRDATELFASIHRWVAAEPILRGCEVGLLQQHEDGGDGGESARTDASPVALPPAVPCFLPPSAKAAPAPAGAWARSMLLWSRRVWPVDGGAVDATASVTQLRFELPRGTRLGLTVPFGQAVTLRVAVRDGGGGSSDAAAAVDAGGGGGPTLLHESGLRSPDGGGGDDLGCRASTSGVDLPCRVDDGAGSDDTAAAAALDAESEFGGLADDADERASVVSGVGGDAEGGGDVDDDGRSVTSLVANATAAPVPAALFVRAPQTAPSAGPTTPASIRHVELTAWPSSDPLATDFFDVFVAPGTSSGTAESSSLLLALQPGDTVELSGPAGRLRPADASVSPIPAAAAADRLQRTLTASAHAAVSSRGLALALPPSPSAPYATAAWPWAAARLTSIGALAQGPAGLAAVLPLLHTAAAWARRRLHLAGAPITAAVPSPAPAPPPPAQFRVHVVVDVSSDDMVAARCSSADGAAAMFPLSEELAEVVAAARGAIVATVLLPHGSAATPTPATPGGLVHTVALPSVGQPLARTLAQLQQPASPMSTPLWPPPSEGALLLLAGDARFVAAGDDAARECYYLASQVQAVDVGA